MREEIKVKWSFKSDYPGKIKFVLVSMESLPFQLDMALVWTVVRLRKTKRPPRKQ